jgi:citrate synthase
MLTAQQAADRLGIKLETLYAYVSRGRLRSVAVEGSRQRHYREEDIEAFHAARSGMRASQEVDTEALMPIIDSSICLIDEGRLYYRGQDAIRLSDSATLEDVARLLWQDETSKPPPKQRSSPRRRGQVGDPHAPPLGIIERCQIRLAELSSVDSEALDLSRFAVAKCGWHILAELVATITGTFPSDRPVHAQFAARWGLDPTGADLVRRCLVLLADHELNASTFAARCVASTGASPYAAVSAALGALSGHRHGGAATRVETAFHALKGTGDPIMAMAEKLFRGDDVPGIGQPLYPEGDPRAVAILYALSLTLPQARRLVGRRPNVDFALAAATTVLGLPQGTALALFVVGRTVGWVAHAMEQYESGVLIRPRARYIGIRLKPAGEE